MKIHGIELEVGEKPPAVTSNALLDFNDIFLNMFKAFEKGDIVLAGMSLYSNEHIRNVEDIKEFGMFAIGKVWKNLAYKQLIRYEKRKLTYESEGKLRKKTLTILTPTPVGLLAHEKGDVITVMENYGGPVQVGIGLPYGTFNALWKRLESMSLSAGVAKTRVDKWYYEFKAFYKQNLLNVKREKAEKVAIKWARQHIASAPTRFGRRNRIKEAQAVHPQKRLNQSLGKWVRDGFPEEATPLGH
jgi:hypothetical protein